MEEEASESGFEDGREFARGVDASSEDEGVLIDIGVSESGPSSEIQFADHVRTRADGVTGRVNLISDLVSSEELEEFGRRLHLALATAPDKTFAGDMAVEVISSAIPSLCPDLKLVLNLGDQDAARQIALEICVAMQQRHIFIPVNQPTMSPFSPNPSARYRLPDHPAELKYSVLSIEDVEGAAQCFTRCFIQAEALASAVRLTYPDMIPFAKAYCRWAAMVGLSWVAKLDGSVVGVLLLEPSVPEPSSEQEGVVLQAVEDAMPEKLGPVFAILESMSEKMEKECIAAGIAWDRKKTCHLLAVGVNSSLNGFNIAFRLTWHSLEYAIRMGYNFLVSEATGRASQHIAKKHGLMFAILQCEIDYNTWGIPAEEGQEQGEEDSGRRPFTERLLGARALIGILQRLPRLDENCIISFFAASVFAATQYDLLPTSDREFMLRMYAVYSQGRTGDCTEPKPPLLKVAKSLKWNAWMGCAGMTKTEAQEAFVSQIATAVPNWEQLVYRPVHALPKKSAHTTRRGERAYWMPDKSGPACKICGVKFDLLNRRHHCRLCGCLVCGTCSEGRQHLPGQLDASKPVRVCDWCRV